MEGQWSSCQNQKNQVTFYKWIPAVCLKEQKGSATFIKSFFVVAAWSMCSTLIDVKNRHITQSLIQALSFKSKSLRFVPNTLFAPMSTEMFYYCFVQIYLMIQKISHHKFFVESDPWVGIVLSFYLCRPNFEYRWNAKTGLFCQIYYVQSFGDQCFTKIFFNRPTHFAVWLRMVVRNQ